MILINIINVFIIINNYVSHLLSWNKVRFAGVYLSLHIPCPFGTVLKAANEMHKDSRDSLFSEQNRFRLSDYNDLVSCSCCLVCTNCILFCLQSLYFVVLSHLRKVTCAFFKWCHVQKWRDAKSSYVVLDSIIEINWFTMVKIFHVKGNRFANPFIRSVADILQTHLLKLAKWLV